MERILLLEVTFPISRENSVRYFNLINCFVCSITCNHLSQLYNLRYRFCSVGEN